MNMMTIVHLAVISLIGTGVGLGMRHYQPGPTPMALNWSIIGGILGAIGVPLLGAWIGLFSLGDFMFYCSAPIGAVISLLVYNIIIAEE